MISYPDDRDLAAEAKTHDIPAPVLVRDLVRIVEVLNLREQGFFSKESVLAGSMALRSFGSPRFTVYDTDFSTSAKAVDPPTAMKEKLSYQDEKLAITPADLVPHDEGGTAWVSTPISFTPRFTRLVPDEGDRTFKADVSFRGMVMDGLEVPLAVPYDLGIWEQDPVVFVMDPHETVAEKILGWCVHRQVKHYADLAYIAIASNPKAENPPIKLDYRIAREALDAKLTAMRKIQPTTYAAFPHIDALVGDLSRVPQLASGQWARIMYVRAHRDRFKPQLLVDAVTKILAPGLRKAAPR